MKFRRSTARGILLTGLAILGGKQPCLAQGVLETKQPAGVVAQTVDEKKPLLAHFDCTADGSKQPVLIQFPADYSPEKKYPLLIYLSYGLPSAAKLKPSGKPYFKVYATGHRMLAFPGLADQDVLAVIKMMKRDYPVDERRVFLNGFSAGGSAVMVIASRYPDQFAGAIPLGAFGNNAHLENLYNLPVFCHHGQRDWTSAIGNVRVYFQQLRAMGAPALLKEYPTAGHSVGNPVNMDEWLMAQQRNDSPQRILYRCDTPDEGRAYWLHIRKFTDIHQDAQTSVQHHGAGDQQSLIVQADNISVLQFALDKSPVDRQHPLLIQLNEDQLNLEAPLPPECVLVRGESGWLINNDWKPPENKRRAYRPGSAANLYSGEPLLVVYGTHSEETTRTAALKRIAEELARCGGPYYMAMSGSFPVKADRDVTKDDLSRYNLLLVGESRDNDLVKRMADQFPFSISASHELKVAGRTDISVKDAVLGFSYFNPLNPQRFVYVFTPHLETAELSKLNGKCARLLLGADGLRKGDQPDLVVQSVDRLQRCHLQFDQNWKWKQPAGSNLKFPERFQTRTAMAECQLKIMRRRSAADYGIWWGPKDKLFYNHDFNILESYDPRHFTRADYSCKTKPMTSMTGSVTGAELRDIYERWIAKEEITIVPPLDPASLKPDQFYRLVLPHELVVKLGRRQKTLTNVAEGPAISPEEILREIFHD